MPKNITQCLILIMTSFSLYSREIKILPKNKRYKKKSIIKTRQKNPQSRPLTKHLKALKTQNEKLEKLLSIKLSKPHIFDKTISYKYPTGTFLRGTLLNSILSTNINSPVLINLNDKDFPPSTRLICHGVTKFKRVQAICSKIIIKDSEYQISATLLNIDGSLGLKGDFYDGKEAYYSASIATSFIKGISEVSKITKQTSLGIPIAENLLKNKLLEGSTNALERASDLLTDEAKTKEPIVFVKSNTEILIYLNRKFEI